PDQLPAAERDKLFQAWLAAERKEAVKWTTVRPVAMEAGPSRLLLQSDGSILAIGDPMKRDVYSLKLPKLRDGITAIRVEAMPHDSLPDRGPGRAFYEGPKGDSLLGEVTLTSAGKPVKIASASATAGNPAAAFDGQPQTGWAGAGKAGRASAAVFTLAEPQSITDGTLTLLFERHYSASLGHFRIAVATDKRPIKARDIPAEIEDLLTIAPTKLMESERARLLHHWAQVAPELKKARAEIEELRKRLPKPATTLVLR